MNLDYRFKNLEMLVREAEITEKKTDYEWIILSKYSLFLNIKKEMYQLQMKIHNSIDEGISVNYCFNHGNPSISHMVNKNLINLENSKIGFVVSDIAKYYVLNENINIDWKTNIDEWLEIYQDDFYKTYFKFLVYYLLMLNLHINLTSEYLTLTNYIMLHSKLKKVQITFQDYK